MNDVDKNVDDFVLQRSLYHVSYCRYSLNIANEFVSKHFPRDMPFTSFRDFSSQIDISIDVFGLTKFLHNSVVVID